MRNYLLKVIAISSTMTLMFGVTACNKKNMMHDEPMAKKNEMKTLVVENVVMPKLYVQSGTFMGEGNPPIIRPGESVSIKFNAAKGQKLMFVTMFGTSADWFFAPENGGIKLFDDSGAAMTGDVSNQVKIWDNGTKMDKEHAEDNTITALDNMMASDYVNLSLDFDDAKSEFTLTIRNVSNGEMATPLSPGVWAVSNFDGKQLLSAMPFFTGGQKSTPEVTAIAEGGDISMLKKHVEENTGLITGLSPVLAVVYDGIDNPIFHVNMKDKGMGLKEVAETGNSEKLMTSLKSVKGVKDVFVVGDGPIAPGQKVMKEYEAAEGCKIAFVTMYGFSNDWFYANSKELSAVANGEVTESIKLYDAGTAVSQFPGAGNHQAVFMGKSVAESLDIMEVGDMYPVPMVKDVIKVSIK